MANHMWCAIVRHALHNTFLLHASATLQRASSLFSPWKLLTSGSFHVQTTNPSWIFLKILSHAFSSPKATSDISVPSDGCILQLTYCHPIALSTIVAVHLDPRVSARSRVCNFGAEGRYCHIQLWQLAGPMVCVCMCVRMVT